MARLVVIALVAYLANPLASSGAATAPPRSTPVATPAVGTPPPDAGALDLVIEKVKQAIDEYQANRGSGAYQLPALSSVDFDFKTISAATVGLSVSLFIFKLGGSHQNDTTSDVTFTYSIPKPVTAGVAGPQKPPELQHVLAQAIQSAANALKNAPSLDPLKFSKLTVMIQYGAKWEGTLGVGVPVSFVVLGANAAASKSTTQSVKLTFQ